MRSPIKVLCAAQMCLEDQDFCKHLVKTSELVLGPVVLPGFFSWGRQAKVISEGNEERARAARRRPVDYLILIIII